MPQKPAERADLTNPDYLAWLRRNGVTDPRIPESAGWKSAMPEPQNTDPVADKLRRAPIPNSVRADVWDAYEAATDADDLAKRLQSINAPQALKADLWDLKSQAAPKVEAPATTPAAPEQPAEGALRGFAKGVVKSGLGLVEEGGNLIRSIPGVGPLLSKGPEITLPVSTKASNTSQAVGKATGDVAQFFVPGMGAGSRMVRGAKAAGLTLAQTGSPTSAGVSGAITAALPGAGAAARLATNVEASAEKSIAQALGATKEWAKSEAAKVAPEVLKRGIGGSRQAMLAQAEAVSARVGKELNDAYAVSQRLGQTVDGPTILGYLDTARQSLLMTTANGVMPIPGTQAVVHQLDSLSHFVSSLGKDIPMDKAVALKRTWDQIVSKAGLYGQKAAASSTDSADAWAFREAASAFRELINQRPTLSRLNDEAAFWTGLKNVLTETMERTQAQSSGLGNAVRGGAGMVAGATLGASAGTGGVLGGAALGGYAAQQISAILASPAFKTQVSAPMKKMLADALASGNAARIESAVKAIMSATPSLVTQGAR